MWWQQPWVIDVVGNIVSAVIGAVIALFVARWNRRRKLKKDEEARQRQYETDRTNAPIIKDVSFTCRDDDEWGTVLTVTNLGKDSATDVRVSFPSHRGAGEFNFEPTNLPVLHQGESAEFKCRAKSIHFLNPYIFGRGNTAVNISWNAPHFPERQKDEWHLSVDLPPDSIHPIVEMDDWKTYLRGGSPKYRSISRLQKTE